MISALEDKGGGVFIHILLPSWPDWDIEYWWLQLFLFVQNVV